MKSLIVVLDNLRSSHNVGSIIRSAVSFRVCEFIAVGTTPYPEIAGDPRLPHIIRNVQKQIFKTSLGAEKHARFIYMPAAEDCIGYLKGKEIGVIALEQSENSLALNDYCLNGPSALVIGSEVGGVSGEFMKAADEIVEISQPGPKESLNAAVAAGITIYELTK